MPERTQKRKAVKTVFIAVILCLLAGQGAQAAWKTAGQAREGYVAKASQRAAGWKKISKKWYYFNSKGKIKKGWLTLNGRKYYLSRPSGARCTGWKTISGKRYYFQKDGSMLTDAWKKRKGKYYYLQQDGTVAVNRWVGRYRVGSDGARTGKTRSVGLVKQNGKYYFYSKEYVKLTGWQQSGGKKYYFGADKAALTGLQKIGDNQYYFGKNAAMVTGWLELDGRKYYFAENGAMIKNMTLNLEGVLYTFDENGFWIDEQKGMSIAEYAQKFKGNPYVYGGTSLTKGADCSGFTMSVMKHFKITIPRTAEDQRVGSDDYGDYTSSVAVTPNKTHLKAGDLVFYGKPAYHVALYIGDGKVIHAATEKDGIIISKYNYDKPSGARRYW